jgi:uncharacterized paraquat-inducible protein A
MSKRQTTTPYERPAFFGLCRHCQTERALNAEKLCDRCEQARRNALQNTERLNQEQKPNE